ncbi:MAG: redoxin domain-containing protein [Gammaproteobacteria bacterium]|nr:redoxin domain-containing protein [Gammaproteobacteria bacterium]
MPAAAWHVSQWFNAASLPEPPSLENLRGRVILLHSFQMLCPGCGSHGIPQAEKVHRRLGSDDFAVIGLHTVFEHHDAMRPVSLEAFLYEYKVTHPVGVDVAVPGSPIPATMQAYGMRGNPTSILIDRAGYIRAHRMGAMDDLELGFMIGLLLSE